MSHMLENRIAGALGVIEKFGNVDGGHHKQWLLDQVVQSLTGPDYTEWVRKFEEPQNEFDGGEEWDKGIAP